MTIQDVLKERTIRGSVYVDCPSCDGKMVIGRHVCHKCTQACKHVKIKLVLQTDDPEFVPKKNGAYAGCNTCRMEIRAECYRRVDIGHWLLCEIPDAMDYLRVGKLKAEDLRDIIVGNINGG